MRGILEQDRLKTYIPSKLYEFDFSCRDLSASELLKQATGINVINIEVEEVNTRAVRFWSFCILSKSVLRSYPR